MGNKKLPRKKKKQMKKLLKGMGDFGIRSSKAAARIRAIMMERN